MYVFKKVMGCSLIKPWKEFVQRCIRSCKASLSAAYRNAPMAAKRAQAEEPARGKKLTPCEEIKCEASTQALEFLIEASCFEVYCAKSLIPVRLRELISEAESAKSALCEAVVRRMSGSGRRPLQALTVF